MTQTTSNTPATQSPLWHVMYGDDDVLMYQGEILMTVDTEAQDDREPLLELGESMRRATGCEIVEITLSEDDLRKHAGVDGRTFGFDDMATCAKVKMGSTMVEPHTDSPTEVALSEALEGAGVILFMGNAYRVTTYDSEAQMLYAVEEEDGVDASFSLDHLLRHGVKVMALSTVFDNRQQ